MEIISYFEPKRALCASCGTLTIEDMLRSQHPRKNPLRLLQREVHFAGERTVASLEQIAGMLHKAKTALLIVCVLVCTAAAAGHIFEYAYAFAGRLTFAERENTDISALNGKMRNFALASKGENFDADGNISLTDNAEKDALFSMPVTYAKYTVAAGDSISSITKRFGLKNISTLIAVNDIKNARLLRAGQKLTVPSLDGLVHTVKEGDSLASIAQKYGVSLEKILDVNELSSAVLLAGERLFIPGARLAGSDLKKALGELFASPLSVRWRISSAFGWRMDPFTGVRTFHTGIDLVVPHGTPIKASMAGTVAAAGYSNVYGNYVIINHGNGYQTLYAHMVSSAVKRAQHIGQGGVIGYVGSTGYSTGAHLHFSVYKDGKLINPMHVFKF
ncbi:peptidoglycan DD-metalloendopeptidase family protein [Treponema lecithinolyticum]|jgi:lysM domain/M23/M37 peptidase domain protein|uniref:peptidoglycan DD-metalloendopeptidase family protein n=1 Tax=Treponema lecithinolyticum TaxID=53418 RepID=UPI0036226594